MKIIHNLFRASLFMLFVGMTSTMTVQAAQQKSEAHRQSWCSKVNIKSIAKVVALLAAVSWCSNWCHAESINAAARRVEIDKLCHDAMSGDYLVEHTAMQELRNFLHPATLTTVNDLCKNIW